MVLIKICLIFFDLLWSILFDFFCKVKFILFLRFDFVFFSLLIFDFFCCNFLCIIWKDFVKNLLVELISFFFKVWFFLIVLFFFFVKNILVFILILDSFLFLLFNLWSVILSDFCNLESLWFVSMIIIFFCILLCLFLYVLIWLEDK